MSPQRADGMGMAIFFWTPEFFFWTSKKSFGRPANYLDVHKTFLTSKEFVGRPKKKQRFWMSKQLYHIAQGSQALLSQQRADGMGMKEITHLQASYGAVKKFL